MQMKSCLNDLGKGKIEKGYIFYGEEEYLKEQALGQLRRLALLPGMEMMDEQTVEDAALTLEDYRRMISTPPFMSPRRLVIVRDDPRFTQSGKPSKADIQQTEQLSRHLSDMATLVFYQRGEIAASQGWLKLLGKYLTVVNFAPLSTRNAVPWIRRMAKEASLTLEDGAAEYLFEYTGGLLKKVESEMGKLAAYCREEPAGRRQIEAICVQAVEYKVFTMVDHLLGGRTGSALATYRALLGDGEPPMRLLSILAGQIRVWARAGELADADMTAAQAAKALGAKPFVMEKALRSGRSAKPWGEALMWCSQAEWAIKQGKLQEGSSVEQLVMKLALAMGRA
jgi:DNA polymerase-3 subunit delta